MAKVIEFTVHTTPVQKGNRPRAFVNKTTGKAFFAPNKKSQSAERQLAGLVARHAPEAPWSGPVRLDVTFVLPISRSWPKWKQEAARAGRHFPCKRPDRGNLLKLLEDVLEGPFYLDDKQVVAGDVAKAYGDVPSYRIRLEELEEEESPTVRRTREKTAGGH